MWSQAAQQLPTACQVDSAVHTIQCWVVERVSAQVDICLQGWAHPSGVLAAFSKELAECSWNVSEDVPGANGCCTKVCFALPEVACCQ